MADHQWTSIILMMINLTAWLQGLAVILSISQIFCTPGNFLINIPQLSVATYGCVSSEFAKVLWVTINTSSLYYLTATKLCLSLPAASSCSLLDQPRQERTRRPISTLLHHPGTLSEPQHQAWIVLLSVSFPCSHLQYSTINWFFHPASSRASGQAKPGLLCLLNE